MRIFAQNGTNGHEASAVTTRRACRGVGFLFDVLKRGGHDCAHFGRETNVTQCRYAARAAMPPLDGEPRAASLARHYWGRYLDFLCYLRRRRLTDDERLMPAFVDYFARGCLTTMLGGVTAKQPRFPLAAFSLYLPIIHSHGFIFSCLICFYFSSKKYRLYRLFTIH